MNDSMFEGAREWSGWNGEGDVLTMYTVMQQAKDGRRKQGKRYPLALILTSLLLAKAAGETT